MRENRFACARDHGMWSLSEVECICADAGPKLTLGEEQVVTLADGRHLVINEWTMSSHESSIAIVRAPISVVIVVVGNRCRARLCVQQESTDQQVGDDRRRSPSSAPSEKRPSFTPRLAPQSAAPFEAISQIGKSTVRAACERRKSCRPAFSQ